MAKKSLLYVFSPVELVQYALHGELMVVLWRYPKGFRCKTLQGTEPISTLVCELCIELTSRLIRIWAVRCIDREHVRGGFLDSMRLNTSRFRASHALLAELLVDAPT